MTDPLAQAIMGQPDVGRRTPQMRYGTVTQVSPLLVKVGASTIGQPCNRLSSYLPVLGDYVMVIVQGADRLVVGSANATAPFAPNTFTPTMTAAGGGLNGGSTVALTGTHHVINGMVTITEVTIVFGGTSVAAGTGVYSIALPPGFPAISGVGSPVARNARIGTAEIHNGSGSVVLCAVYLATATTVNLQYPGTTPIGAATAVGATSPFVPVAGYTIWSCGAWTYETPV